MGLGLMALVAVIYILRILHTRYLDAVGARSCWLAIYLPQSLTCLPVASEETMANKRKKTTTTTTDGTKTDKGSAIKSQKNPFSITISVIIITATILNMYNAP